MWFNQPKKLAKVSAVPVTRDPVPIKILKKWHPSVAYPKASTSKAKEGSDIEDSSGSSSNKDGSPSPRYSLRVPPPSQRHLRRSEDEVEDDIITISGKQSICTSKLMIQVLPLCFR